jgi:uncharacterized SAM-binding protein YcdF (DUF218 family)
MFFTLSKVFWAAAEPANLATLAALLGLALLPTRFSRAGRSFLAIGVLALAAGLFTPTGALLLQPLEGRFPKPPATLPEPAGIIVLGGGLNTDLLAARGSANLGADGARLIAGAELAHRYPAARLIFTGGSGRLRHGVETEAEGAKAIWLSLGVPAGQMIFEGRSRNTWENAVFTRDLLGPKTGERWLLVTSAWHMPRSIGVFRRIGFDVIAFPVDYRTFGDRRDLRQIVRGPEGLVMLGDAVHEWIGLLAYRLSGKTDALLPEP